MNRHEIREQMMFVLYQHLLLKIDLQDCVINNFEDKYLQDEYINIITNDIKDNEDTYISSISSYLNKWEFNRLNYVEQAILLLSYTEIKNKIADKAIIIDEAVIIAKKYCDDDSYKFINGVLDKL